MDFDYRQKKAIETDGTDLFVSASAGSGKTTVMIERIMRLIEGGGKLDRMMIATFTKAAAADMKAKLFRALSEKADNPHCKAALKVLPAADIGTLHSFCAKLSRTYFYAIDADPMFEILGDESDSLIDRCLDRLCDDLPDEDCERLYDIMLSRRKDGNFRKVVKRLYLSAYSLPDPKSFLDACSAGFDDARAKGIIDKEFSLRKAPILSLAEDCRLRIEQAGFKRNIPAARELCEALRTYGKITIAPSGPIPPMFVDLNSEFAEIKVQAKKLLEEYEETVSAAPSEKALPATRAVVRCVLRLAELCENEKKRKGVCDYNDLEHYAFDVLSSDCGDAIRAAYDYIFVDEYQDINPLQDAIIEKLKRENNLFAVGDIKQSIYAFRGCDPSIFGRKCKAFEGKKGGVELNLNFRTRKKVIDKVNEVFSLVMKKDFGGVDYSERARLEAGRKDAPGEGEFEYYDIVTNEEEETIPSGKIYRIGEHRVRSNSSGAEKESDFIVNKIAELLSRDEKIEPKDVAVLTRSRGDLYRLTYRKLKELGIPVCVKDGEAVSDGVQASPIIAMLELIDNSTDDISLVTVLSSYLEELSFDDLAEIAETIKDGETFSSAARRHPKSSDFFRRLDELAVLAQSVSVSELLSKIVTDREAFVKVRKMSDGDGKCRALAEFLALAGGEKSVRDFLDKIGTLKSGEAGEDENSVKIMTVHASKGLEFKYVFVGGLSTGFNSVDLREKFVIDRELGFAFKYPNEEKRCFEHTLFTRAALIAEKKRTLEEEMRIMYVAMTRAKEQLVMTGVDIPPPSIKQRCSSFSRPCDFLKALTPTKIFETDGEADMPQKSVKVIAGGDRKIASERSKRLASEVKRRSEFVYPFNAIKAKTSVTAAIGEDAREDDGFFEGEPSFVSAEDASLRGTAYHKFLQRVTAAENTERELIAFSAEFPEEAALIDSAKAKKAAVAVASVTEGMTVYREKEFIFDFDGELVQGVIDVLAIGGGKAVIVDYKTGRDTDKISYKKQLGFYAEAVKRILGYTVERKYIYAIDEERLFEMGE